jgi:hypothetical protein
MEYKSHQGLMASEFLQTRFRRERWSRRFEDLVGFNAVGAYRHPFGAPVHLGTHFLEIRKPTSTCPVVGMTNVIAADRSLSAYVAYFCHAYLSADKFVTL